MSRKSNKVTIASYGWKDGASEFRKFDAAKIANELERVREKDGVLKPSNVVDAEGQGAAESGRARQGRQG